MSSRAVNSRAMNSRDRVLARIDAVVPPRPAAEIAAGRAAIERDYLRRHSTGDVLDLLADRIAHYRATVRRVTPAELPGAVAARLAGRVYAVPGGLPRAWLARADPDLLVEDPPVAGLDAIDGAVTGCAVAIAETGTVVLDHGPGQGPRALTLVPDRHLVVVEAARVVADVPEALERLDPARPLTFVSGPSATSDIELSRVEGVHGPRTLDVLVVA
ncbi:LUD domain-containing protein [Actinomadura kijaniata]|uniref:L-lactate dehydrogenase complex protein LldG n=2 Tax=Actinomadura TaxID=1988 RepID=A0A7W3LZW0_ACTNM|nr:L-lactate dehydrogenase complex protein LldG [Actinomadura namibiensis]